MDIQVTQDLTVNGSHVAAQTKEDWLAEARRQNIAGLNGPKEQTRILTEAWDLSVAAHPEVVQAAKDERKAARQN